MQAVKKMRKPVVRIAKPVNRVVTASPAKLKAALPKRPKCRVDGHPNPEGGTFKCVKPGRSRALCVNHYNMFSRRVRRKETTWKELEKAGLASPVGERVASEGAKLIASVKKMRGRKRP